MKAKELGLMGLGLVGFMALGPFAIFPALAGLAYISRLGAGYHEVYTGEIEAGKATA